MKEITLKKILLAIAWLNYKNLEVNKKRVARYTGISYVTVNRYFEEVLPSLFLLDDQVRFEDTYKVNPLDKKTKLYKGGYYE